MVPRLAPRIARRGRTAVAALLLVATGACSTARLEAVLAPSSDLWERWSAHDARSAETVDHGAWSRLLRTYVATGDDGVARFAYAAVTPQDRAALDAYIGRLEAVPVSRLARNEQFAFWVNLYNAVTVRTVLEAFPVASIRDINDGLLSAGPWDRRLATVEGVALSLNDIEHRILRPIWRDPRLHYAVNCAAVGCPNLAPAAYVADGLNAALDRAARAYVNDPRGVRRRPDGALVLSSIYVWFEEDFGGGRDGVLAHLRRHATPRLRQVLAGRPEIAGSAYDWALNGR